MGLFPFSYTKACCGPVNSTHGTCESATQGSSSPFEVSVGLVINNRTSGSTAPNDTSAAATIISTSTMTAISTAAANAGTGSASSSKDQAAIGAGVGAPLGLALLGALAFSWRQRRREQGLKMKAEAWEKRCDALAMMKGQGIREDNALMRQGQDGQWHELEDARTQELDGVRVHDAHELAGWKPRPK